MELYYCKVRTGSNFGDDLNVWLWPKLFEQPLSSYFNENTLFVGIGTILSAAIPCEYERKIVFSSGTGYGRPPVIDDSWDFSCVRGPLTAKKFGLAEDKAITDGAVLLHNLIPYNSNRSQIGFMPHHQTAVFSDWETICKDLNLKYIDPRWSVKDVIEAINSCDRLITEAMHGAIVADVLRVPWYAVKTRRAILDFKWHDWTMSMQLDNSFTFLPPVVDQGKRKFLKSINSLISRSRIRNILNKSIPQLSKERVLNERYNMMIDKLDELKNQGRSY